MAPLTGPPVTARRRRKPCANVPVPSFSCRGALQAGCHSVRELGRARQAPWSGGRDDADLVEDLTDPSHVAQGAEHTRLLFAAVEDPRDLQGPVALCEGEAQSVGGRVSLQRPGCGLTSDREIDVAGRGDPDL